MRCCSGSGWESGREGSRVTIAASTTGTERRLCSGDIQLHSVVVEQRPLADYGNGWLTITLSRARNGDDVQ